MDFPTDFPQKNYKRAKRREQFKRFKKRAEFVAKYIWSLGGHVEPEELNEIASKNANNLKRCGCWMCRNPRRVFKGNAKITMQERKQNEADTTTS